MPRALVIRRAAIGAIALIAWLLFFSGGLLIETIAYRRALAPESFASQSQTDGKSAAAPEPYRGNLPFAFLAATLCFTPTNLVFVTLFAGLLGGCASNIVAGTMHAERRRHVQPRSLMYLEETPWSAMIRSFIVYLCVIAGLYFAMDDPFKNSTPAQYMRLAGTLSLLAFVVGYDPSKIEQWLRLVPGPQPSQVVTVRDSKEGLEMRAAQGLIAAQMPAKKHDLGADELVIASVPADANGESGSARPANPR